MEIKKSNIECFGCNKFRAYYSRSFCNLYRERFGYCEQHNKIVQQCDYCDKWHRRRVSNTQYTSLAIDSIGEIYEKIAVVEQMLKEEIEIQKLNREMTKDKK